MVSGNGHAQKFMAQLVASEFSKNGVGKEIPDLLIKDNSYRSSTVEKEVKKYTFFKYNPERAKEIIDAKQRILSLSLYAGDEYVIVDMVNVSDEFSETVVKASGGEEFSMARLHAAFYRGIVRGREKESLVALTITDDEISGFISSEKGNLVVGKLGESDEHITYLDADLLKSLDFECGSKEPELNKEEELIYNGLEVSNATAVLNKCVGLYYETEFDMYNGSISSVVVYVSSLHNQVASLYYNEGIVTRTSFISVWTTPDPYSANDTEVLLGQFQGNTSYMVGDLGMLLTTRDDVEGGRAAGFNGICNSNIDNRLSVSLIDYWHPPIPRYSWSVNVVAHEFGHLFGSRHTHACVWNGNNSAIDSCGPYYNLDYMEGICYLLNPAPLPAYGGGTIMSYCHLLSSTVGIGFANGFGPQPGNVIRSNVANSCLEVCNKCLTNLVLFQPITASENFRVSQTITSTAVISNGAAVVYEGKDVYLKVGFYISGAGGSKLKAAANPCELDDYPVIDFDTLETASESTEVQDALRLYPNPANSAVTIALSTGEIKNIVMTSIDGKTVLTRSVDSQNQFTLDITAFSKGIYLITIEDSEGNIQTEKLIKE
jgi:hypothetical protein